jgi:predicted 3-demethylubiquinone-9 3-methyltransferase (glyoxalase superfamily)
MLKLFFLYIYTLLSPFIVYGEPQEHIGSPGPEQSGTGGRNNFRTMERKGKTGMKQKIVPCLWFDHEAEEAAKFYESVFNDSKIIHISHYGKESAKVSGQPEGSVLTVEFKLMGQKFIGLNGGPVFKFSPAVSLYVGCKTAGEVDRLFTALSEGGGILMPLDKYKFSERYAWVTDRFGVPWQLFLGPSSPQAITPCLMFVKERYGKAEEAARFYTFVFEDSTIDALVPYEKDEGEKDGAMKHISFSLSGSNFIAMDSGKDHAFGFTPAISFMVECETQKRIDRLWEHLSFVPEAEQCGWLQDQYGVSWQIVPSSLGRMMKDKDAKKTERVMEALMPMKKLDKRVLERAFRPVRELVSTR